MKKPSPSGLLIPPGEITLIAVGAFRYYLGRQSAGVSGFGRWLQAAWADLDENTKTVIARDLEEAFRDDDRDRKQPEVDLPGAPYCRLGHDCDRAVWSRIRALYRIPMCCLCGKEMGEGVEGSIHLDGEYSCSECAPSGCEVCEKPFQRAEQIVPNSVTRRARHPGCKPLADILPDISKS